MQLPVGEAVTGRALFRHNPLQHHLRL